VTNDKQPRRILANILVAKRDLTEVLVKGFYSSMSCGFSEFVHIRIEIDNGLEENKIGGLKWIITEKINLQLLKEYINEMYHGTAH
tara:strand:- start:2913 stop:3170 length:258 start_codon:yes stop_codon:yes gene_type:complete